MKFFYDRHNRHYPVQDIVCIREYEGHREPGKSYYSTVELREGREVQVSAYLTKVIIADPGDLLPALPGFSLLKYWFDPGVNDEPYISEDPVLGWMVGGENGTNPITIDDEEYDGRCGILCPDGKVRNYDTVWDDRASWEQSMRKDAIATVEAKKKSGAAQAGPSEP